MHGKQFICPCKAAQEHDIDVVWCDHSTIACSLMQQMLNLTAQVSVQELGLPATQQPGTEQVLGQWAGPCMI